MGGERQKAVSKLLSTNFVEAERHMQTGGEGARAGLHTLVKLRPKILNLVVMWNYLASRDALVDKLSRHRCLVAPNIFRSEQELAVQVGKVNGVHVDDMDLPKARQGLQAAFIGGVRL